MNSQGAEIPANGKLSDLGRVLLSQLVMNQDKKSDSTKRVLLLLYVFQSGINPVHWRSIHMFVEGQVVKVVILEFLLSENGCGEISSSNPQEFGSVAVALDFVNTFRNLYESESWQIMLSFGDGKPPLTKIPPLLILQIHQIPLLYSDISYVASSPPQNYPPQFQQTQTQLFGVVLRGSQMPYLDAAASAPQEPQIEQMSALGEEPILLLSKSSDGKLAPSFASRSDPTHALKRKERDGSEGASSSDRRGFSKEDSSSAGTSGKRIQEGERSPPVSRMPIDGDREEEDSDGSRDDEKSDGEGALSMAADDCNQKQSADQKAISKKLESISLERLSQFFHLPISKACRELGVGLTVLKKKCRGFGITRWPHRKMKSIDTLIGNIKDLAKGPDGRPVETVIGAVVELENEKKSIGEMPSADLGERTKKLRQACFKASYKKRRYTVNGIRRSAKMESGNEGEAARCQLEEDAVKTSAKIADVMDAER